LSLFINTCGSIHNGECGSFFAVIAYSMLLPAYPALILLAPVGDATFWLVFGLITFSWSTCLAYLAIPLLAKRKISERKQA